MSEQLKMWSILDECECTKIWNKIYKDFKFCPCMNTDVIHFEYKMPMDVYDISTSLIWCDNEEINEKIRISFIECLKDEPYMYALDWQHTSFRYNPRISDNLEYPVLIKYEEPIKNEHLDWEGYNVYFPTFYPDGDYYFFVAKDFSWGYLTHPWLKRVYIFGDSLKEHFERIADEIGFVAITK